MLWGTWMMALLFCLLCGAGPWPVAKKKTTISDPPPDEEIEDIITV